MSSLWGKVGQFLCCIDLGTVIVSVGSDDSLKCDSVYLLISLTPIHIYRLNLKYFFLFYIMLPLAHFPYILSCIIQYSFISYFVLLNVHLSLPHVLFSVGIDSDDDEVGEDVPDRIKIAYDNTLGQRLSQDRRLYFNCQWHLNRDYFSHQISISTEYQIFIVECLLPPQ